ncbi:MAG: serine protease [Verrucomicrobiales bacterium]|nr:serine protease [Verrucomicrobiales bacterium]
MCRIVLSLLVFVLTNFLSAEELSIDDAAIRESFLEQVLAVKESENTKGLNAAALRRELKKEKQGIPGLKLLPSHSRTLAGRALYETARRSTLIIGHLYLCDSCDEWHTNLAAGVALSKDGTVVTNYHVLQFERASIFAAMDHRQRVFPIREVLASDKQDDLAVIQLDTDSELDAAPLTADSSVGDSIGIVSHPDAHFFTFTTGEISRFSIDPGSRARRLEVTAPFARGSSGSGIFDFQGNLVGFASATNAIYYEEDNRERRNLQMVIYSGAPTSSLLKLISGN